MSRRPRGGQEDLKTRKNRLALVCLAVACALVAGAPSGAGANAAEDLGKAKEKGRVAFVLVTEPGAAGVEEAEGVVRDAVRKAGNAVMVRLDRRAAENTALVSRYRISGPQIPLVLVIVPNGAVAGGILANELTTDRLLGMIPSRCEAEIMKAVQAGQGVLVVAARRGVAGTDDVLDSCERARTLSGGKLAIVRLDLDDPKEQRFITRNWADASPDTPVTVVFNSRGQPTGVFVGPVEPSALVSASAKTAGGCCPGGRKGTAACAPAAGGKAPAAYVIPTKP